jgi:hypothetical protein
VPTRVWLISALVLFFLGCAGAEKEKETPVVAREVTLVALASPAIAGAAIKNGDVELEPLDLFGDAVSNWTTMTGEGFGGRRVLAAVVLGPLIGNGGSPDHQEDILAMAEQLPFSTLFVPSGSDATKAANLKSALGKLGKFGYSKSGAAILLKGSEDAGKKYLRLLALHDGVFPKDLDKISRDVWVIAALDQPYTTKTKIPKRVNLLIAPASDGKLKSSQASCPVLHIPALTAKPYSFYSLTLSARGLELVGWSARLQESGSAPGKLEELKVKLKSQ